VPFAACEPGLYFYANFELLRTVAALSDASLPKGTLVLDFRDIFRLPFAYA